MQPTKALQETLYKEMLGRIKQTDLSVPSRIGEYFYYSRTEEGKQYPIMCRRARARMDRRAEGESCSTSTRSRRATSSSASAPTRSATTPTGWPTRSTRPATGSTSLHVKDLRDRARRSASGSSASARSSGRPTTRRSFYTTEDAVSKRSRQGLPPRGRRRRQRPDLRGAGRAVRRRRRPVARQEGDLPRLGRQDVDRGPLPAGGDAGGGADGRRAASARPRVRRRSLQRRASTSRPTRAPRTSGGQGADRRSVREELDSRSSTTTRRCEIGGARRSSPITWSCPSARAV